MNREEYEIVFRWKKVPLTEESSDYYGSMGAFRDYDKARVAWRMLSDLLGDDWEVWINMNVKSCMKVYPKFEVE